MRKTKADRVRMAEEGRILAKMNIDDIAEEIKGLDKTQLDLLFEKVRERIDLAERMGLLKTRIRRRATKINL